MHILTIDYETYWTKPAEGYTLSKMPASLYVMDPRFKAHGAAVKLDGGPSKWVSHKDLPSFFDKVPWNKVFVLGHNSAEFDNFITEWIYGRRALGYIDTISVARAVLGVKAPSFSLDKLGEFLGLGGKMFYDALTNTQGIRDLPPQVEKALVPYAIRDNDLCYAIFRKLKDQIPASEWVTIDWCAKTACRPTLALNGPLLWEAHDEEVARKKAVVASVGFGDYDKGKSIFNSNDKFAALLGPLLEAYGEELPMKRSKGKKTEGQLTYAFSASDEDFVSLQEHPDEDIAALVEARLAVKGSIVETRTARMAEVADAMPGSLWPVGLKYSGAMATHRYSGSGVGGGNCQNLKRGSKMRDAVIAPDGYVIVAGDLSQIELRNSAYMAGHDDILDMLRREDDLYSYFAGHIYEREILKSRDPDERQIGKVACVAENGLVLTARGEVRIQDVQAGDLLWDGVEYVAHGGVVFTGVKDVIEYDGVVATADHKVLTSGVGWVELGEAARCGYTVEQSFPHRTDGRGGEPLQLREAGDDRGTDCGAGAQSRSGEAQGVAQDRGKARTYDILNCGPRNRFTVNGRIVHNCLSLGYEAAYEAFMRMLLVQAKKKVLPEFAQHVVKVYRETYAGYPDAWRRCRSIIAAWCRGDEPPEDRLVRLPPSYKFGVAEVITPSGLKLKYHGLCQRKIYNKFRQQWVQAYVYPSEERKKAFWITDENGNVIDSTTKYQKIHGSLLFENLSQNGAREVMSAVQAKLRKRAPWMKQALQVHDELVTVVPAARAAEGAVMLAQVMNESVDFWPDLPVAAEVGVHTSYGQLKKLSFKEVMEKYNR